MPKKSIRQELLSRRRRLEESEVLKRSVVIQQKLLNAEVYQQAPVLALYAPIHNEVRTDMIFSQALQSAKEVCFPRISDNELEFVAVKGPDDLQRGAFGIAEPTGRSVVAFKDIDLAVIPGVGFDRTGYRLGYGGGYYDRVAGTTSPGALAGLAYDFQIVDELPAEEHDIRIDLVVTDSETLAFENINSNQTQYGGRT